MIGKKLQILIKKSLFSLKYGIKRIINPKVSSLPKISHINPTTINLTNNIKIIHLIELNKLNLPLDDELSIGLRRNKPTLIAKIIFKSLVLIIRDVLVGFAMERVVK